jgi:hypothetical protein
MRITAAEMKYENNISRDEIYENNSSRDYMRITAAEMKYMRKRVGYTWTDHKTNTEIAI